MSWRDSIVPAAYAQHVVDPLLWNYHQLCQQGLPQDYAIRLANAGITWRETEPLVRRECPPALILRLLLPDEDFAPETEEIPT